MGEGRHHKCEFLDKIPRFWVAVADEVCLVDVVGVHVRSLLSYVVNLVYLHVICIKLGFWRLTSMTAPYVRRGR